MAGRFFRMAREVAGLSAAEMAERLVISEVEGGPNVRLVVTTALGPLAPSLGNVSVDTGHRLPEEGLLQRLPFVDGNHHRLATNRRSGRRNVAVW